MVFLTSIKRRLIFDYLWFCALSSHWKSVLWYYIIEIGKCLLSPITSLFITQDAIIIKDLHLPEMKAYIIRLCYWPWSVLLHDRCICSYQYISLKSIQKRWFSLIKKNIPLDFWEEKRFNLWWKPYSENFNQSVEKDWSIVHYPDLNLILSLVSSVTLVKIFSILTSSCLIYEVEIIILTYGFCKDSR